MGDKPYFTQARLEECTDENDEFFKCPECDDHFDGSQGVAWHYSYQNEGSIGYLYRCEECGRLKFGSSSKNRFCSKWCETHNRVGTLKHLDKDYLQWKIVEEGLRAVDVAEELGVKKSLIHKWVRKYEIGDEYDCPSCEKSFASKQGVSKHHKDKHGESISGQNYTCKNCGDDFWDMKCESHHITPQFCSMECRKTGSKNIIHDLTGHDLDSTWEKEVDEMLYYSDLEYEHEPETFQVDDTTNKPDFASEDWILEIKSRAGYRDKERLDRVGKHLRDEVDREYIILGEDVDMPCNRFVEWGDREEIVDILSSI